MTPLQVKLSERKLFSNEPRIVKKISPEASINKCDTTRYNMLSWVVSQKKKSILLYKLGQYKPQSVKWIICIRISHTTFFNEETKRFKMLLLSRIIQNQYWFKSSPLRPVCHEKTCWIRNCFSRTVRITDVISFSFKLQLSVKPLVVVNGINKVIKPPVSIHTEDEKMEERRKQEGQTLSSGDVRMFLCQCNMWGTPRESSTSTHSVCS